MDFQLARQLAARFFVIHAESTVHLRIFTLVQQIESQDIYAHGTAQAVVFLALFQGNVVAGPVE